MTIDQYLQASVSLLLDIRNNTRPEGTEALSLVELFPAAELRTENATPPKATRQRKAASTAAETGSAQSTTDAKPATESAGSTASDDLFGDSDKAADKPAETKKEETKKVKPPTQDDVRNALVEVQTALKSKDAAVEILAKHTTGNVKVLSKLPESAYAALIKECKEAVAKAPK